MEKLWHLLCHLVVGELAQQCSRSAQSQAKQEFRKLLPRSLLSRGRLKRACSALFWHYNFRNSSCADAGLANGWWWAQASTYFIHWANVRGSFETLSVFFYFNGAEIFARFSVRVYCHKLVSPLFLYFIIVVICGILFWFRKVHV